MEGHSLEQPWPYGLLSLFVHKVCTPTKLYSVYGSPLSFSQLTIEIHHPMRPKDQKCCRSNHFQLQGFVQPYPRFCDNHWLDHWVMVVADDSLTWGNECNAWRVYLHDNLNLNKSLKKHTNTKARWLTNRIATMCRWEVSTEVIQNQILRWSHLDGLFPATCSEYWTCMLSYPKRTLMKYHSYLHGLVCRQCFSSHICAILGWLPDIIRMAKLPTRYDVNMPSCACVCFTMRVSSFRHAQRSCP